ncbi:MAG TPA: LysR family transcriptional regulator [Xanthobacteraceae bacterium]|nr:LysR family transcriptional regulator [Xanthobacteraceae bacterium]
MTNIPTDLLRTLVAVVDQRSFTKASQLLGVTQPAVSAQIKRLQAMLGGDLLDKSAPGVALTPLGEMVVTHARRMLTVNDQILHLTTAPGVGQTLRVGIPADFAASRIAAVLGGYRERNPDVRFHVRSGHLDQLMRELRQNELDIAVGVTATEAAYAPRHWWVEEPVWIRSEKTDFDPLGPVPLVSRGGDCPFHRAAVTALYHAGLDCEFVFTAQSHVTLQSAVALGFGMMVQLRSMMTLAHARNTWADLAIWENAPLPQLQRLYSGIYLRDGGNRDAIEALADEIATLLRSERDPLMSIVRLRAATGA